MKNKCIICHKHDVTFPKVCYKCQDKESQLELRNIWIEEGIDPDSMRCRTCGMIHDGGWFCNYCGDCNPTDDPDIEAEHSTNMKW